MRQRSGVPGSAWLVLVKVVPRLHGTASDLPDTDAFALCVVSASAHSFPYLIHLLMVSSIDVLPFVSGSVC